MKVLTAKGMAAFDKHCIGKLGIPGLLLMEHAGYLIAKVVSDTFDNLFPSLPSKKIFIACGSGNNGGDGFVAARHLIRWGYKVTVGLIKVPQSLPGDALTNFNLLKTVTGCKPHLLDETTVDSEINGSNLVVDALFGTGLNGALRGIGRNVVEAMNASAVPVISADIPSGLSADDGSVCPDEHGRKAAVKALKTVTMGLPKLGFFSCSAREYLGQLLVADIGFPGSSLLQKADARTFEVSLAGEVRRIMPPRKSDGHKGSFGRVLIIGGSRGMAGAIAMAARSALRSGAGIVLIGVPESIRSEVASMVPEAMTSALPEDDGVISKEAVASVLSSRWNADCVLIGPGIGRANTTMEFVKGVISKLDLPIVLDADALFVEKLSLSLRFRTNLTFLTPHEGEASRILSHINPEHVDSSGKSTLSRIGQASSISQHCDSITVLKGAFTLTTDVDGNHSINPNGNSGMATAGSGDILAGVLVSLVAQAVKISQSPHTSNGGEVSPGPLLTRDESRGIAAAAVYLHGLAGDLCAEEKSEYGVTAPGICEFIPKAFRLIMNLSLESERAYPVTIKHDRLVVIL